MKRVFKMKKNKGLSLKQIKRISLEDESPPLNLNFVITNFDN